MTEIETLRKQLREAVKAARQAGMFAVGVALTPEELADEIEEEDGIITQAVSSANIEPGVEQVFDRHAVDLIRGECNKHPNSKIRRRNRER